MDGVGGGAGECGNGEVSTAGVVAGGLGGTLAAGDGWMRAEVRELVREEEQCSLEEKNRVLGHRETLGCLIDSPIKNHLCA